MTDTERLENLNNQIPTESDDVLADKLRMLAFRIAYEHPISAAHLAIAAAGISPASTIDITIAHYFFHELCDFSNELNSVHQKELAKDGVEGRLTIAGIRVRGVGGHLGTYLNETNTVSVVSKGKNNHA